MDKYAVPYVLPQLGTSDHNVILWKPIPGICIELEKCNTVSIRCIGKVEKAKFAAALANVGWEPLFRLQSCARQFALFQSVMNKLIVESFPCKNVKRHTADKPWVTDGFRKLIKLRQRIFLCGNMSQMRKLRNQVNRV